MKKIISMLMVVVMVLSLCSVSVFAADNSFKDVKKTDYYYDAVKWAVDEGIVKGTSETTFSPNDYCTHEQIMTMVWRANGQPIIDKDDYDSDCRALEKNYSKDYFKDALIWLTTKNWVDSLYASTNTASSRLYAVKLLYRVEGIEGHSLSSIEFMTDLDDVMYDHELEAIAWAIDEDITKGTSYNTFSPNAKCTRAQIVTFLYRAYANR